MKDTLIGITTMTVLFGIVWLSQNRANTNKSLAYKTVKPPIEQNYTTTDETYMIEKNHNRNEMTNPCGNCNEASQMHDNLTFSEAFKLCRECLGNEGIFTWKENLYSTKVKETEVQIKEENLVVKGDTESIPPPEENKETVSSN